MRFILWIVLFNDMFYLYNALYLNLIKALFNLKLYLI